MVSMGYLSLQYVKLMNWIVRSGSRIVGCIVLYSSPYMYSIFGLSLVGHWHLGGLGV